MAMKYDLSQFLLAADATKRLKLRPCTFRQWVCRGHIRIVKASPRITLVPLSEIERIEAEHEEIRARQKRAAD